MRSKFFYSLDGQMGHAGPVDVKAMNGQVIGNMYNMLQILESFLKGLEFYQKMDFVSRLARSTTNHTKLSPAVKHYPVL